MKTIKYDVPHQHNNGTINKHHMMLFMSYCKFDGHLVKHKSDLNPHCSSVVPLTIGGLFDPNPHCSSVVPLTIGGLFDLNPHCSSVVPLIIGGLFAAT